MSDEEDDKLVYAVTVSRVQEQVVYVRADTSDAARSAAEDSYESNDWETVHVQTDHAELITDMAALQQCEAWVVDA